MQVWGEILQMTEELSLMYKSRAEALANHTVNRVNTLIAERKAIKKNYSEERSTLDSKRSQLGDSVSRLQQDYEKALDSYKNAQAKHEDLNNKSETRRLLTITCNMYGMCS
ncbi:PREDICTED: uncharacterized protein LOC106813263 [Priapulus caudatus]|uniref:Uncharacterized protein LOC106813263 n=1 Tax=Priapulus caudatus TaxID=37621 RepID=A0ABM1EKX6_PRICU|nr:PREDICTED: uncharacterized protein LOC106813263 [Priapulus caudatus]